MFGKPKKSLFEQFDEKVSEYLTALAYIQNSIKLSEHEKTVFFTVFEDVVSDVSASVDQLRRSGINMFNRTEAEEYLKTSLPVTMAEIGYELRKIQKAVKFDPYSAMPVQAAIDSLTKTVPGKPSVAREKIDRLYSFGTLFDGGSEAAKEEPARPSEEDNTRFDRAMDDIRLKAFLEMLRGTSNRNPEYFFKANSFVTRQMTDAVVPYGETGVSAEGVCFAATGSDSIGLRYRSGDTVIEYTVVMRSEGDSFFVSAGGYVDRNGARVDFSVSEKYPAGVKDTALNSFGLGRLIEKHRESERAFRNGSKAGRTDERNAKKAVDDFFNA